MQNKQYEISLFWFKSKNWDFIVQHKPLSQLINLATENRVNYILSLHNVYMKGLYVACIHCMVCLLVDPNLFEKQLKTER